MPRPPARKRLTPQEKAARAFRAARLANDLGYGRPRDAAKPAPPPASEGTWAPGARQAPAPAAPWVSIAQAPAAAPSSCRSCPLRRAHEALERALKATA